MGSNVMLDLVGSFIIGGMLIVNLMNLNANAAHQSGYFLYTAITQKYLVTSVDIIENDFRKLGYGVVDPTKCILHADTSKIVFKSDIDRNGIVDQVTYYLGSTTELSGTPNPNDRPVYRVINSETPVLSNLGITKLYFRYFDQDLNITKNVNAIKIVEITLEVQSTYPLYNEFGKLEYPSAYYKQTRITSRNINR